jgi:hypothetical protein
VVFNPFEPLKKLLALKIESDHITHFYEGEILFGQCFDWRNFTIQDSFYYTQYLRIKDKVVKELKEKRCIYINKIHYFKNKFYYFFKNKT